MHSKRKGYPGGAEVVDVPGAHVPVINPVCAKGVWITDAGVGKVFVDQEGGSHRVRINTDPEGIAILSR